jgi:hypothetical protein
MVKSTMTPIRNSVPPCTANTLWAAFIICLVNLVLICPRAFGLPDWSYDVGGHIRWRGMVSTPADGSRLDILDRERLHDGAFEFRSTHAVRMSDTWRFDLHYELIGIAGETQQANSELLNRYPLTTSTFKSSEPEDNRRLLDLSHVISDHEDYLVYHRLDRLVLTGRRDWGTLRIGRQALTWGNGFLFNPMDLFNPFSPTDVERDYKIGDDMVTLQGYRGSSGEIQLLYVPRRDSVTGDVEWKQSSAGAKYHIFRGGLELDIMAGYHYDDYVAGLGLVRYIGNAAWRLDATYTLLSEGSTRHGFASFCTNIDYSWVWWGKNMYGWIEYYYTGLGTSTYEDAWEDHDIMDRISRGERSTLGRSYLDAQFQVELHPLVNFYVTVITNLADPSGVMQPRITWDASQNLQVTAGADVYAGEQDTEFGGFDIASLPFDEAPSNRIYIWVSYFY